MDPKANSKCIDYTEKQDPKPNKTATYLQQ